MVGCLAAIVITILLTIVFWFIFVVLDGPSESEIDQAIIQGDIILAAIKEYHTENGVYPSVLTDLVPETIAEIPSPTGTADFWEYHLRTSSSNLSNKKYQLSHDWGGSLVFPNPIISSSGSGWSIDTK